MRASACSRKASGSAASRRSVEGRPCPWCGHHSERRVALDASRLVQRQSVADASAAVMANHGEGLKLQKASAGMRFVLAIELL